MDCSRACALGLFFVAVLFPAAGCDDDGCDTDADCPGQHCADDGSCVACVDSDQCSDGSFCCAGSCVDGSSVDDHCGCAPQPGAGGGTSCSAPANVCLVGDNVASAATVADGVCGCTCDAAQGGTICTLDDSDDGFTCGCNRNDPDGTCGVPALDDNRNPHVVADTCTPLNSCVCFAANQACDPDSDTPDCSNGGCVNVLGDDTNCGVSGRDCTDAATGIAGTGTCENGGCACDALSDCQGAGLNVDSCVILTAGGVCVCGGYQVQGSDAPCPLGLPCTEQGCTYQGSNYATDDALFDALGIQAR